MLPLRYYDLFLILLWLFIINCVTCSALQLRLRKWFNHIYLYMLLFSLGSYCLYLISAMATVCFVLSFSSVSGPDLIISLYIWYCSVSDACVCIMCSVMAFHIWLCGLPCSLAQFQDMIWTYIFIYVTAQYQMLMFVSHFCYGISYLIMWPVLLFGSVSRCDSNICVTAQLYIICLYIPIYAVVLMHRLRHALPLSIQQEHAYSHHCLLWFLEFKHIRHCPV